MGNEPPVWSPDGLSPLVSEEFRSVINPSSENLIRVVHLASRYAVVDRSAGSPRLVMRRRSFLCGLIEDGLERPDALSSSSWIVEWAKDRSTDLHELLRKHAQDEPVRAAIDEGARLTPGRTIDRLFPRAIELANRTVGREQIDLRHLLVALLERPGNSFDLFNPQPTDDELAELQARIVDEIVVDPEPGENVAAWMLIRDERIVKEDDDRLPTQTDNPATKDLLGRDVFASVLAKRIKALQQQVFDNEAAATAKNKAVDSGSIRRAFMIHVHGPWGAGKSSFLQFLKAHLESKDGDSPQSMVVWFNAWEHHSRRPPWWLFLNGIYGSVTSARQTAPLPWNVRLRIRARWWSWRVRSEWIPIVAIVALGALLLKVVNLDTLTKVISGFLALAAAVYAIGKGFVFGSTSAAEAYTKLTDDPLAPVVRLFNSIAGDLARARRPLVVLVDDLDRCDAEYLVDLLEGIQNLFKGSPVTYVAAADRDWICNAFEKRYSDFSPRVGEPARPLGYLFLDKLFQISAGMPRLTQETQEQYLRSLTGFSGGGESAVTAEQRAEAHDVMAGLASEEEIQAEVKRAESRGPAELLAAREAAALQFTTARVEASTERRLMSLMHLMEPNPRAMKLLVNEVAMAQARGTLEGRYVQAEARARWSILSLRWPLIADHFAEDPKRIGQWISAQGNGATTVDVPEQFVTLLKSRALQETIGQATELGALNEDVLRRMIY
jgi:hypothetical protein